MKETMNLKTDIFISYRREVSEATAVLLKQALEGKGYDVFLDVANIGSGKWRQIIWNEIGRRPYFLLILAPETLRRCEEWGDMLRAEIEQAISTDRRIVPIMTSSFSFKDAKPFLTGLLQKIPDFNGINLRYDAFQTGVEELCSRFLVPISLPDVSFPEIDMGELELALKTEIRRIRENNPDLMAQMYFEKALSLQEKDPEEALKGFTQAIDLNPKFASAYLVRYLIYYKKGDFNAARKDLDKTIELDPLNARAYCERASMGKDYGASLSDFAKAMEINPNLPELYYSRAMKYWANGKSDLALADCNTALRLDPQCAVAFYIRGFLYKYMGHKKSADLDFQQALQIQPGLLDMDTLSELLKARKRRWFSFLNRKST